MLGLQRDLSLAIAEQIGRRLSPERLSALTRRQPQSDEAYVLYLKGRGLLSQATPATNARAIQYVPPYAFALVHAGLDERDAVFEWLARASDAHDVHLVFLTVDSKWDPYRADPRFQALVKRCGFRGL